MIAILSIIPVATTALALTNSMHNYLWVATETANGLAFTDVTDHYWYNHAFAPFVYGLIGFFCPGARGTAVVDRLRASRDRVAAARLRHAALRR